MVLGEHGKDKRMQYSQTNPAVGVIATKIGTRMLSMVLWFSVAAC